MDIWVFNLFRISLLLGSFIIATYVVLPKAVKFFFLWKKTDKIIYLSSFVSLVVVMFFLLVAVFIMFIKSILGISCS